MTSNYTIVVNSCDAYEVLWVPFFKVLKERWKALDCDIVLNTETKSFTMEGLNIRSLHLGKETKENQWGGRLINTLEAINTKYVISLFDDFILESDVNIEKIDKCLSWMEENEKIAAFYLINIPQKNQPDKTYEGFDLVPQGQDYRLNSAPAIWRREKLIQFTGRIDTPWAWETFGSTRTFHTNDLMYCVKKGVLPIYDYQQQLGGAIHRGKWVRSVIEPVVDRYALDIDLNERGFDDENAGTKYTLKWKINFFRQGFRMVGMDALIVLYHMLAIKLKGLTKR